MSGEKKPEGWIQGTVEGLLEEAVAEEEVAVASAVEDIFDCRVCPRCGYGVVVHTLDRIRMSLRCLNRVCGWEEYF